MDWVLSLFLSIMGDVKPDLHKHRFVSLNLVSIIFFSYTVFTINLLNTGDLYQLQYERKKKVTSKVIVTTDRI